VGGKTRTARDGSVAKGWDHDPPAKRKWTPLGILMVASGALSLLFGSKETSDFWVDGLKLWVSLHPATGDLLGQRSQLLGNADPVLEADGGVRGLVGA
jgi:hypothetical protein